MLLNSNVVKLGLVALGAIATVSASAALEPVQVESVVVPFGSASAPISGGTVNLAFDEFNPAAGNLVGITITLDSYDNAESTVFCTAGAGSSYSAASVSGGSESVSALGLSTATTTLSAGPFSGVTTGFFSIAGAGNAQYLTASEIVQPADFSSYIGNGSRNFDLVISPGTGTYSGVGPASVMGFGGIFDSYGTVKIDYSYVAMPESASFSLLAGVAASFVTLAGLVTSYRRSII